MSCKIVTVLDENGNPSKLFEQLKNIAGTSRAAVAYAKMLKATGGREVDIITAKEFLEPVSIVAKPSSDPAIDVLKRKYGITVRRAKNKSNGTTSVQQTGTVLENKMLTIKEASDIAKRINAENQNYTATVVRIGQSPSFTIEIDPAALFMIDADQTINQPVQPTEEGLEALKRAKQRQLQVAQQQLVRLSREKDTAKQLRAEKRIEQLQEEINNIAQYQNVELFIKAIDSELKVVKDLLNRPTLNDLQITNAIEILNNWANDSFIQDMGGDLDSDNPNKKTFTAELVRLHNDAINYKNKLNKRILENIQEKIKTQTGRDIPLAELQYFVDTGQLTAIVRDISTVDNPLLQMADLVVRNAVFDANTESANQIKELQEKSMKYMDSAAFKRLPNGHKYDYFIQEDSEGKSTGRVVARESDAYYKELKQAATDYKKRIEDKTSTSKQSLEEYYRWWVNNHDVIDPSRIENDDIYFEKLVKKYGEEGANDIRQDFVDKINRYRNDYDHEKEIIETKVNQEISDSIEANKEIEKQLRQFEMQKSPFFVYDQLMKVKNNRVDFINFKSNFIYSKLIANDKHVDPKWKDIQNTPELKEFYDYFRKVLADLYREIPYNFRQNISLNTIPKFKADIIESFQTNGLANLLAKANDDIASYLTDGYEDSSIVEMDPVTGEVRYTLRPSGLSSNTEFNSQDLPNVLKAFILTTNIYKHKQNVENTVRLVKYAINNAQEIKKDKNKEPIKDRDGKIIAQKGLKNLNSMYTSFLKFFYGSTKDKTFGDTPFSKMTTEQKEKLKEAQTQLEQLEFQFKNEEISPDNYNIQKAELEKRIDDLKANSKIKVDNVLDAANDYTRVTSLGFNVPAAIGNMSFGSISNFIHAAGGRDFTNKTLSHAYRIMLDSVRSNVTFSKDSGVAAKTRNILDRLGVIDQIRNAGINKQNLATSTVSKLSPYALNQSVEFINYGASTVASLLHEKITTKDGKEISLWNAFDDKGQWNRELFTDEVNEQWDANEQNENTNKGLKKYRNKIVQVNKLIHGNYDKDSNIAMSRNAIGRLLLTFRRWVFEGWASRFEGETYDQLLERTRKGRYRTYFDLFKSEQEKSGTANALFTVLKTIGQYIIGKKDTLNQLSEVDAENMRKNIMELIIYTTLASMLLVLKQIELPDDDPRKRALNALINQGNRLTNDMTFYVNPYAQKQILQQNMPAMSLLTNTAEFMNAAGRALIGDDEIGTGHYKGESRLLRETFQLFPVSRQVYNLRNAMMEQDNRLLK